MFHIISKLLSWSLYTSFTYSCSCKCTTEESESIFHYVFMWFLIFCFLYLTPKQKEPYEVAPLESLRFENSYKSKKSHCSPDSSVLVSDQSTVFECYMHPPLISFAICIYMYICLHFSVFLILSFFWHIVYSPCFRNICVFGYTLLYRWFLYTQCQTLISSVL
jgi:hypothetical protein